MTDKGHELSSTFILPAEVVHQARISNSYALKCTWLLHVNCTGVQATLAHTPIHPETRMLAGAARAIAGPTARRCVVHSFTHRPPDSHHAMASDALLYQRSATDCTPCTPMPSGPCCTAAIHLRKVATLPSRRTYSHATGTKAPCTLH